ncbi:uncharacterized protein LOC122031481 [Zingiber officinale]|uniref:uncharacterized protein LOC122031481 n=1 Tax=Zingiber officinale TaxID=94328 RepID=UPI001C4BD4A7|nr:uncharacterized protein LOC122031481 [Zingiber officinale]
MNGFTKLGFPLIFILLMFSLLGLAAKFLYHRRCRCSRFPADPERTSPFSDGPAPGALLIRALCFKFKHRSRIEPASAVHSSRTTAPLSPTEEDLEECDLARWHAIYLGPSRALYTIKEEETEEEADHDADETPFATPCASFRFNSEAPSLRPEPSEVIDDAGELAPANSQALRGDKRTVVSGEIHDKFCCFRGVP